MRTTYVFIIFFPGLHSRGAARLTPFFVALRLQGDRSELFNFQASSPIGCQRLADGDALDLNL